MPTIVTSFIHCLCKALKILNKQLILYLSFTVKNLKATAHLWEDENSRMNFLTLKPILFPESC